MIPVIVASLLLLVTVARREETVEEPIQMPPAAQVKPVKMPTPPRPPRQAFVAPKPPVREPRPSVDFEQHQHHFTTPPPIFKVVMTGYNVPHHPSPY